ncbi:MAG: hypothetical protein BWX97_00105 [Firmicutes bacterium ADurb.Bin146]|nr:MAG: hypothetical protein BWX97_00105 [Firmicutes bacterium ADurb.Bin146]HQC68355.1 DUF4393 domain-containing protein [Clostridia bacterium]
MKKIDAVTKVLPEAYEDLVKPTAQEIGKTLSLIPRTINAALFPLRKWIIEKEHSIAETEKILAKKLKNIDKDKIVTPEAYIAVPALQSISYSMDSDVLRDLYANLLAKAMNKDYKEQVHPSFVEIIKQMDPNDAIIFKSIFEAEITPVIDLYILDKNRGGNYHRYNFTWITEYSYDEICLAIDNLERLKLVEIPYGQNYTRNENYDCVRATPAYIGYKHFLEEQNKGTVLEAKKYIRKTSLAEIFYRVCVV